MADISAERREALIERNRDINVHLDWWDTTYDDFIGVAKAFGFDISTTSRHWRNSHTGSTGVTADPKIYFQLSYSQGDGSAFDTHQSDLHEIWTRGRKTLDECIAGTGEYNADPSAYTGYLKAFYDIWHAIDQIDPVLLSLNSELLTQMLGCCSVSVDTHGDTSIRVNTSYDENFENVAGYDPDNPTHAALGHKVAQFIAFEIEGMLDDVNDALFEALRDEYEHQISDEAVWEAIESNGLDIEEDDGADD